MTFKKIFLGDDPKTTIVGYGTAAMYAVVNVVTGGSFTATQLVLAAGLAILGRLTNQLKQIQATEGVPAPDIGKALTDRPVDK